MSLCKNCSHRHVCEWMIAPISGDVKNCDDYECKRPHGKWITIDVFVVKCSVCGVETFATPFCPRCGADMRGDNNE